MSSFEFMTDVEGLALNEGDDAVVNDKPVVIIRVFFIYNTHAHS
jgi:hypothetical protein